MPYLFNRLGEPWLTQRWTRFICRNAYKNKVEGLVGNEDVGQMSAWYVLSAIGIHQACPGDTRFELTSPVFRRVRLHLPEGKTFTILAKGNNAANVYIRQAKLDGCLYPQRHIDYHDLMSGGTLTLRMSPQPEKNSELGIRN